MRQDRFPLPVVGAIALLAGLCVAAGRPVLGIVVATAGLAATGVHAWLGIPVAAVIAAVSYLPLIVVILIAVVAVILAPTVHSQVAVIRTAKNPGASGWYTDWFRSNGGGGV